MEYREGDIVIICKPRPVNKILKGKRVMIYKPQALSGTSVYARFIDKKDWQRFSAKYFLFHKDEICLEHGQTGNDLLPMPPESGPPLPRGLGIKWPRMK